MKLARLRSAIVRRFTLPSFTLLALFALSPALPGCAPPPLPERVAEAPQEVTVCPGATTIEGMDISSYQPNTNWPAVAAGGITFAFIKATESTGYVNSYFAQDWQGAKDVGVIRGAYHYFHADVDPVAQADHFVNVMGQLGPDDLPGVLDLEDDFGLPASQVAANGLAFLERVEALTGKRPIVYTGPYFFYTLLGNPDGYGQYPLWIAHYGANCPDVPTRWDNFMFWQYTSTGGIQGVQGANVDHNIFNGSIDDLRAFAAGGGARVPAQVTGNDAIAVASWPDGHEEAFVVSTQGSLLHTWTSPGGIDYSPFSALDGKGTCGFTAALPPPAGSPEVVSPTTQGATVRAAWDGSMWSALDPFGGEGLTHLSSLVWNDGRVDLFALGKDDKALYHRARPAGGAFTEWAVFHQGPFATGAGAVLWGDGHAEVFATGEDGIVKHTFSGSGAEFPDGWFAWMDIPGKVASRPVPARWADGHIEVYARSPIGRIVRSYYDAINKAWITWETIDEGPIEGDPSVFVRPSAPGPEIVARTDQGKVASLAWDGSAWTALTALHGQATASDPFGWTRADGRAHVFTISPQGTLIESLRNDQGFTPWSSIGGPAKLSPCVSGAGIRNPSGGSGGGGDGGSGGGGGDGGDDGGCGCRAAGQEGNPTMVGLTALFALGIMARRRRR